jgi:hypothetical protein
MTKTATPPAGEEPRTRKQTATSETPAQIRARAAKAKPDAAAFAKAARYAANAKASKRFAGHLVTPEGYPIFRFRKEGDTLTGIVGQCNGQMGYGASTYPVVLDDGSCVHIIGHRRLVKALHLAKCRYQRITITFEGKIYNSMRHYEMVYTVTPAPLVPDPRASMSPAAAKAFKAAADAKARKAGGK